ncbi:unnamed protein product [Pipistrellus nathusii]|uniref:Uncharacterized protein n=1 Tax=Pipistrellus nathusii TaxID=59473 RepID=A0ABP0A669_PIPNA
MPPEAFELSRARASGPTRQQPRCQCAQLPGKPWVRGQRAACPSQVPRTLNGFHDQLRKVCSQSMWRARFRGILVVPMSCKVGRAHVWSLKHPRKIGELHSYTEKMKEPARKRSICDAL